MTLLLPFNNYAIMPGSIPKAIIPPPRQTPGHLTFLKMLDQIPRYMGRFQGQMPHWLGMKSQNFHSLSGIDERIVEEIFGSQSTAQGLKARTKITHQYIPFPWIQNRYVLVPAILYSFEGLDKTPSAWLMLFCAERFISVVCLLPIILRRDNCAFIDYFKRLTNERFHIFF